MKTKQTIKIMVSAGMITAMLITALLLSCVQRLSEDDFIDAVKSNNNNLQSLTISRGTLSPAFAPSHTAYTATVEYAITTVQVTAVTEDDGASMEIRVNGASFNMYAGGAAYNVDLESGDNLVDIKVTAENGRDEKTYTVTVTRLPADNARLANITINPGTLDPAFAGDNLGYASTLSGADSQVTITPVPEDSGVSMEIKLNNGSYESISYGQSKTYTSGDGLISGNNTVLIKVTSIDTSKELVYSISINKEIDDPANNDLSSLVAYADDNENVYELQPLVPLFDPTNDTYNLYLPVEIEQIYFIPAKAASGSSIEWFINGISQGAIASASSTGFIPIPFTSTSVDTGNTECIYQETQFQFTVTAQSGGSKNYYVTVRKYQRTWGTATAFGWTWSTTTDMYGYPLVWH